MSTVRIVIRLDQTKWMDRRISEDSEQVFVKSVARRAKMFLMWKIVAEEHVGVFPKEIVWEGEDYVASPTRYKVMTTEPKGELQVTPKTQIICVISQ